MADNALPAAKVSPRLANGAICWYAGDTFSIKLKFDLEDQDGAAVTMGSGDTAKITFRDKQKQIVKEYSFSGITDNTVELVFDDATSALFGKGDYTYDALYTHGEKTTLARDGRAKVE
jgi:hypothetical protein